MDDIKRKKVKQKFVDSEIRDMPKQFRQREEGKKRLFQTLDSLVEQEITFPKKVSDKYSQLKKYFKKK